MTFRRSIAGVGLGLCLLMAGCGGGGGGGGSDTIAQASTPPGGAASSSDGTGSASPQTPAPSPPDTASPGPVTPGTTPPTPPDPTPPPSSEASVAEKLAALGEWWGSIYPGSERFQIALLDTGSALAIANRSGVTPTRVYVADLAAPVPPPASFQLEVTAFDLQSATVGTETWDISIPNPRSFLIESDTGDVMEMVQPRASSTRALAALPGDWVLDLRAMGETLGPWPVTIDDHGQFRYEGTAGCRATGHFADVVNSSEWVSMLVVITRECSQAAGGASFRGLLRRIPPVVNGATVLRPETLVGGAATGNRRHAISIRGERPLTP